MKENLGFLVGILTMTLFSCSVDNHLERIRIIYGSEYATVIVPVTCSSIEYDLIGVKKKVISEKDLLQTLEKELGKLKAYSDSDTSIKIVDVRIKCFLDYRGRTDTLCLGGFNGVLLNGKWIEDNPDLLHLLKSNIYTEE